MSLGLQRGTIRLQSYDPNWAIWFEQEKQQLLKIFGTKTAIEHVGSTAIPHMSAKPIIDMIVSVENLSVYRNFINPLAILGYEYMPDRVFDDRVFFRRVQEKNVLTI